MNQSRGIGVLGATPSAHADVRFAFSCADLLPASAIVNLASRQQLRSVLKLFG